MNTRIVEASAITAAQSALDHATDEVLTNHASESGRWLRFNALLELAEDFNDFPCAVSGETPDAVKADVTPSSHTRCDIGNEAPPALTAGASSEAA